MLSALINTTEQTTIPVMRIATDGGTQMRVRMVQAVVTEYAAALIAGQQLPPIVLFYDGQAYWLADGFHRLAAWQLAYGQGAACMRPEIPAEVRAGSLRDAILYAVGANASHGLRRTATDKRRAVEALLQDAEWSQWSNSEIARRCDVSEGFVRKVKKALGFDTSYATRYLHPKTGLPTTMNLVNIAGGPAVAARVVVDTVTRIQQHQEEITELAQLFRLTLENLRQWSALTGCAVPAATAAVALEAVVELSVNLLSGQDGGR